MNGMFENVRCSLECLKGPYSVLKHQVDGQYYVPKNNRLYFRYDEEYFPSGSGNLNFTILDDFQNTYSYSSNLVKTEGLNYFTIDLANITPTLTTGFYVLEVTNDKNEKLYLRFKI